MSQSQKKPSAFHKEEAGLKVSRTVMSGPTGPLGTNLAPPSGAFCKSDISIKGLKKRIKVVCVCAFPVSRELPVEEEIIQTQLHSRTSEEYYTYSNVPWKLYMRKEVHFANIIWFNANTML